MVGNFNQGAARQGIKMKSHQLQPQHPSIIKALLFCKRGTYGMLYTKRTNLTTTLM